MTWLCIIPAFLAGAAVGLMLSVGLWVWVWANRADMP